MKLSISTLVLTLGILPSACRADHDWHRLEHDYDKKDLHALKDDVEGIRHSYKQHDDFRKEAHHHLPAALEKAKQHDQAAFAALVACLEEHRHHAPEKCLQQNGRWVEASRKRAFLEGVAYGVDQECHKHRDYHSLWDLFLKYIS